MAKQQADSPFQTDDDLWAAWGRMGRRSGDPAPAEVPAAPATDPPVTLD